MLLSSIDWAIVVIYLIGCIAAGIWMKQYVKGVEDFAVAGREMDTNLGVASLAATEVGIVTVMYTAQLGFEGGFVGAMPGVLTAIAMFFVGLSGFVIEPLRRTGVITIPELFEKRFGLRVRWLAGLVVVLGGLLNMGIFLRLGGEFLICVMGFNPADLKSFDIGPLSVSALEITMLSLLGIVLLYTVLGGMVSVLVTDYLQFLVMGAGIVVTSILVVYDIGWQNLIDSLWSGFQKTVADGSAGEGLKMTDPFNPFAIGGGIGIGWIVWQSVHALSCVTTWQTTVARVLAAKNEKTAKKIYCRTAFYWVGRFGLPGLWGAAAFVFFMGQGGLPEGLSSIQAMPAYLGHLLPVGLIGLLLAAMLAAEMSTDSGYMLTWATVIYNDLLMPIIGQEFSNKAKLLFVRIIVVLIGIFLMFWGLLYNLQGVSAWEYLSLTGNIYLASLLALLVGGLYWKEANSWGAYAAIIMGAVGPIAFLYINSQYPKIKIEPWIPGLGAFVLAFAGMVIGTAIGQISGKAFCGEIANRVDG